MNKKRVCSKTVDSLGAEREGFEPPVPRSTTVFKTAAIDHSATSPNPYLEMLCFSKAMQRYGFFLNLQEFASFFFEKSAKKLFYCSKTLLFPFKSLIFATAKGKSS